MQDKINLAIDALASAAFIEGGVSPENTQAARDLTEQRKRELAQAISAPCLHQIQEPPTKTEALAHYSQQAILAMGEASAAAVAVPDEREAFEKWARSYGTWVVERDDVQSIDIASYTDVTVVVAWHAWQARAALAATPAAAAQVVLPEPDFQLKWSASAGRYSFSKPITGDADCYTADTVRALLAGVSAPAAMAKQHPDDAAVDALAALMKAKLAKQRAKGYGGWDTDCTRVRLSELLRSHVDKGDPVDVANFCAFLTAHGESIAPQAQADARDADKVKPEAGHYVLAWMECRKVPIRAMWVPQYHLSTGDEAPEGWGEYSDEKDDWYCPEGWYEANEHEETHWAVGAPVVSWMELPRLSIAAQTDQQGDAA